jgi:H2-forming N5,N10-methylenetetrahydromethanopterin dehydrogenase-like enzyme
MSSSKGKVMISSNDHEEMRKLFNDFGIETLDIQYSLISKMPNQILCLIGHCSLCVRVQIKRKQFGAKKIENLQ